MCSTNYLQKHEKIDIFEIYFLAENCPGLLKNDQNFMTLKKSVRKHFKEAIETLKSKIGQCMPSCSSDKLQKHERDTHFWYGELFCHE